jgi:hypothetical protein
MTTRAVDCSSSASGKGYHEKMITEHGKESMIREARVVKNVVLENRTPDHNTARRNY